VGKRLVQKEGETFKKGGSAYHDGKICTERKNTRKELDTRDRKHLNGIKTPGSDKDRLTFLPPNTQTYALGVFMAGDRRRRKNEFGGLETGQKVDRHVGRFSHTHTSSLQCKERKR